MRWPSDEAVRDRVRHGDLRRGCRGVSARQLLRRGRRHDRSGWGQCRHLGRGCCASSRSSSTLRCTMPRGDWTSTSTRLANEQGHGESHDAGEGSPISRWLSVSLSGRHQDEVAASAFSSSCEPLRVAPVGCPACGGKPGGDPHLTTSWYLNTIFRSCNERRSRSPVLVLVLPRGVTERSDGPEWDHRSGRTKRGHSKYRLVMFGIIPVQSTWGSDAPSNRLDVPSS